MKFKTYPKTFGHNEATLLRENSKYVVCRFVDGAEAFVDRRPRKDSKVWDYNYLVWDIKNNCKA